MKSNFDLKKIRCLATSILILSAVAVFAGCKDNGTSAEDARVVLTSVYDPSQPVGFTSFSPQRASVGGRVVLNGSNFGSDVSNIKVFVDDMEVIVVGADGDRIYIMIPNDAPSGLITIQIGKGSNMKEVVSTESFTYVPESYVGTLSGFTDKDNNSAIKDGPIDEAQYKEPTWLAFDSEKNIYLAEGRGAMRRIDKDLT